MAETEPVKKRRGPRGARSVQSGAVAPPPPVVPTSWRELALRAAEDPGLSLEKGSVEIVRVLLGSAAEGTITPSQMAAALEGIGRVKKAGTAGTSSFDALVEQLNEEED